MSSAHWLLGAHALAAGQYDAAQASFQEAVRFGNEAENRGFELLAEGFRAITTIVARQDRVAGEEELARVVSALGEETGDDSAFWTDQLDAAYRVFVTR